jgi:hypothetical protein
MSADFGPELSIVIATTQPWPEVRLVLDSLYDQAQAIGGEILVADGHGNGWSDRANALFPAVVWLESKGGSVYQLRAMAMSKARGWIVALTEDHCRVAPDWRQAILTSHREFPNREQWRAFDCLRSLCSSEAFGCSRVLSCPSSFSHAPSSRRYRSGDSLRRSSTVCRASLCSCAFELSAPVSDWSRPR